FARELRRERNVLDHALALHIRQRKRRLVGMPAAGVNRCDGDVVEALRSTRADVEDARLPRMIEEIEIDGDRVFDGHEIAPLLAVGVTAAALEQPDFAVRAILVEKM